MCSLERLGMSLSGHVMQRHFLSPLMENDQQSLFFLCNFITHECSEYLLLLSLHMPVGIWNSGFMWKPSSFALQNTHTHSIVLSLSKLHLHRTSELHLHNGGGEGLSGRAFCAPDQKNTSSSPSLRRCYVWALEQGPTAPEVQHNGSPCTVTPKLWRARRGWAKKNSNVPVLILVQMANKGFIGILFNTFIEHSVRLCNAFIEHS